MAYVYKVGSHRLTMLGDGLVEVVGLFPFETDENDLAIPDFEVVDDGEG